MARAGWQLEPELSEKAVERFYSSLDRGDEASCWPWKKYKSATGYGVFSLNRRNVRAHRVAYLLANGAWPGDAMVCHACDNPSCCNPAHLWLGSAKDNAIDASRKGRLGKGRGYRTSENWYEKYGSQIKPLSECISGNRHTRLAQLLLRYVAARANDGCRDAAKLVQICEAGKQPELAA